MTERTDPENLYRLSETVGVVNISGDLPGPEHWLWNAPSHPPAKPAFEEPAAFPVTAFDLSGLDDGAAKDDTMQTRQSSRRRR